MWRPVVRHLDLGPACPGRASEPFHFARAFKATTGLSPRQFVIARRVQRATLLLAASDMPVAEVAAAVSNLSSSGGSSAGTWACCLGSCGRTARLDPSRHARSCQHRDHGSDPAPVP